MRTHHQTELDPAGLIRRLRRELDLSQRDLAARLGVSQASIARWETGESEPSLSNFQLLLNIAGWGLAVTDETGTAVEPMADDACRDRGHRRFPVHLDVDDAVDPITWERRPRARRRHHRDTARARQQKRREPAQRDHPTWEELLTARADARARRMEAAAERARRRPPLPLCRCHGACFLTAECAPACSCGCEVRRR